MQKYNTRILKETEKDIAEAADLLRSGEIVAIPTETVYGLAADASNEAAVKKIFEAKGRPSDNPLIVHISHIDMLGELVSRIPPMALECAKRFWPGPLTMVMPKSAKIPYVTSGGLETVGIRFPSHRTAQRIITASGRGLAAPSANLSGSPSPTTLRHVLDDMNGRIPAVVDGGNCEVGVESTVISFDGDSIRLLRPGRISAEMLRTVTENVTVDKGVLEQLDAAAKAASPGMKYKHYSPKAEVFILKGTVAEIDEYLSENSQNGDYAMLFDGDSLTCDIPVLFYGADPLEQANRLFAVLRECDRIGANRVFARCPETYGVGLAVYNRLLRAAAFRVIRL